MSESLFLFMIQENFEAWKEMFMFEGKAYDSSPMMSHNNCLRSSDPYSSFRPH